MAYLKTLDIGYGYTADGGQTYPFRGQGVGLMPTLDEVFGAFPGRRFLINLKSDDLDEGERLIERLSRTSETERALISLWVPGDRPYALLHEEFPAMSMGNPNAAFQCLKDYLLYGWTGVVPASCGPNDFAVPQNYAPYLWGYPDRLRARLNGAGVEVNLIQPYHGGIFDAAFDDPAAIGEIPYGYGIITNKIEVMGPAWTAAP
jgi:glycerophosphoryl diester phosphodiesterase